MTGSTAAATIVSEPKVNANSSAKANTSVSCSTTDASPASSSDANSPSPSLQSRSKFIGTNNNSTNVGSSSNTTTTSTNSNSSSNNSHHTVCKNCYTVTTPLWRRDESGAVLCNACGLFLKLHGRPRPISLKTDVIKSRNRKGNHSHNHSNGHSHTPPSPRGTPSADDKKRKADDKIKINNKRVKAENREELQRLDGAEVTKAANALGNINRNCNGVTSPTLSASNVSRQLPHLSTLLGEVGPQSQAPAQPQPLRRSNSPLPPPVTMLDTTRSTVSSPSMLPQNPKVYQMSSISDVLSPASTLQQQQPSNSVTDLSGRFSPMAPPQYHQSPPTFLPIGLPRVGSPQQQQQSQSVLENQLRDEEEIIRLRTRISELELVSDLYKRHIFELDEKCKSLQDEVDQIKQQQLRLQQRAQ